MKQEERVKFIEEIASAEEIYEPKYGGKDHSGYDTLMKYEVNGDRYEAAENAANKVFEKLLPEIEALEKENERLKAFVFSALAYLESGVSINPLSFFHQEAKQLLNSK